MKRTGDTLLYTVFHELDMVRKCLLCLAFSPETEGGLLLSWLVIPMTSIKSEQLMFTFGGAHANKNST